MAANAHAEASKPASAARATRSTSPMLRRSGTAARTVPDRGAVSGAAVTIWSAALAILGSARAARFRGPHAARPNCADKRSFLATKIGLGRAGKNPRNTRGTGRASGGSGPAQAAPEA
jgi:hypothetical protein